MLANWTRQASIYSLTGKYVQSTSTSGTDDCRFLSNLFKVCPSSSILAETLRVGDTCPGDEEALLSCAPRPGRADLCGEVLC